jgi:hypothetical protein
MKATMSASITYRDHKILTTTAKNPNKKTTPPIIAATNTTFLLSKSSAITTPIHEIPKIENTAAGP